MEAPQSPPLMSSNLAQELLQKSPNPIPKTDPLMFGRSWMLRQVPPGTVFHGGDNYEHQMSSLIPDDSQAGQQHESALPEAPASGTSRRSDAGLQSTAASYKQLPSHAASDLSYDDFVRRYMEPNQPVVIRGVTSGWRAAAEWRTPDGMLRLEALRRLAGHCRVCVTDTSTQDDGCGVVRPMLLSEYLDWWTSRATATQQQRQQQGQRQGQVRLADKNEDQVGDVLLVAPGPPANAAAAPERDDEGLEAGQDGQCGQQQPFTPAEAPGNSMVRLQGCDHEALPAAAQPSGSARDRNVDAVATSVQKQSCSSPAADKDLMYLKDWHFVAEFPEYGAYRLPIFFADDWLNAYYDHLTSQALRDGKAATGNASAAYGDNPNAINAAVVPATIGPNSITVEATAAKEGIAQGDGDCSGRLSGTEAAGSPPAVTSDYRFCYLGPAGTWTPLHSDVLRSYSWSINVCGRKRWLMLPPRYTHLLYDKHMLRMAPHLELDRVRSGCDPRDFPSLEEARRQAFEFIQAKGDAVFVPSGWHHCVENLYDTLSFNHNWLNGHNCHWTWALLRQQYIDAAAAIDDCRQICAPGEFEDLVQANLAANMGLNWHGFVGLLTCTVRNALASLRAAKRRDEGIDTCTEGLVHGQDAGPAATNALLTLSRAGRLLKDFILAFEELVLRPHERLGRPPSQCSGSNNTPNDSQARANLQQTPTFTNARVLLSKVETELLARGLRVLSVG
ncbi:hypothetical protein VaNZ11_013685 [Volvox africanus]|uniref:JmjC domain-containing protein n=1 Tax=Volvox africanus TaxID=51714 RepID=A0ABQ5SGY3_9CHLO|nr:hypothetical protein VaNZ11_013685 [Volvox africanus]